MAACLLESLVLRGLAVRQDVLAVELRLGTGVAANPEAPGFRNSKRSTPVAFPAGDSTPGDSRGAGRPLPGASCHPQVYLRATTHPWPAKVR